MADFPFPYPAPRDSAARARVEALVAAGQLHEWPPVKGKRKLLWGSSPLGFLASREAEILALLGDSSLPLTAVSIAGAAGYPPNASLAPLSNFLAYLARDGKCFAWPSKKKDQSSYWRRSLDAVASETILARAGGALLSRKEAVRQLRQAIPGLAASQAEAVLEGLLSSKRLIAFAPDVRKPKAAFLLNPSEPGPFLQPVGALLQRLIDGGAARMAVRDAVMALIPEDAARLVLAVLQGVEPQADAHYSLTRLRRHAALRRLTKQEFDQACLALWRSGRAALHYHDAAGSLGEAEREAMVRDEQNTYYIAISRAL